MNEENELLDKTDIQNYENGKYVSKQYTKEEWQKLRKTIEKYPDISLASIEYTLKYRTKYYKF